ncbi:MAG: hypothetical protein H6738_01755 [Alphaproteobacteria bacterium]|nr:hypothetical protein [Alphaproteobacteria bacterium]MCB9695493.1 hypothetical protein [Alphaproteobacteria bacterium]
MIVWFATIAAAQDLPCSVPLTRFDVRTMSEHSSDAIARDDALSHRRLFDELVSRTSCLDHPIDPDAWASLLLDEALVRKATGGDWERPLDTAMNAFPALDLPPFLRDVYSPLPRPTPSGLTIPDDAALFVDGVLVRAVPILSGDHVVQVWRAGNLRSAFLEDGDQVPADWLTPAEKEVVEVVREEVAFVPYAHGMIGGGVGPTLGRQMVQNPAEFLGGQEQYGGSLTVSASGLVPVAGPGSVFWDADLAVLVPSVRRGTTDEFNVDRVGWLPQAWVGGAAMFEELTVGVGAGFATLLRYEGEEPVVTWLPQPHVLLGVLQGRRDFEVSAGVSPAALHGRVRAGALLADPGSATMRLGVDTQLGLGWFTEGSPEDATSAELDRVRRATDLQWTLLGRLDVAWGRDR